MSVVSGIFTVGYEGVSIERFVQKLCDENIYRIIDVRRNPISRKPGFSKTALRLRLKEVGIDYIHIPELGIHSSLRKSLQTDADYTMLFRHYEEHILPNVREKIAETIVLLVEKPSALLCFEEDPQHCHRTCLARHIARETNLTEIPLRIR